MADIKWHGAPKVTHRKVVRSPNQVGTAVYAKALEIGEVAETLLVPHHISSYEWHKKHGSQHNPSSISVTRGDTKVDAFVNLDDPVGGAAWQVEMASGALRKAAGVVV